MNVATYNETTSRLNTRADIGLYHDIALYLRMPIILSNDRKLDRSQRQRLGAEHHVPRAGPPTRAASSRSRSTLRSAAASSTSPLGLDFGFMNQMRDRDQAHLDGRFRGPLRRRRADARVQCDTRRRAKCQCANSSDINRNGIAGRREWRRRRQLREGRYAGRCNPRHHRARAAHVHLASRIKYIEPYAGFSTLFEFAQSKSDFGATDLKGSLVNHPPLQGWVYAGMQVIPWEQREQFQRVTFDGRVGASYRSEGRDYSELFDALGSSNSPSHPATHLRILQARARPR